MSICTRLSHDKRKLDKLVQQRIEKEQPLRDEMQSFMAYIGQNVLLRVYEMLELSTSPVPEKIQGIHRQCDDLPLAVINSESNEYEIKIFFDNEVSLRKNNLKKIMKDVSSREEMEIVLEYIRKGLIGNSQLMFKGLEPHQQERFPFLQSLERDPEDPFIYRFPLQPKFNIRICATIIV